MSEKASSSGRPATCCADQDGIHQVFRALSHPTRLTILEFLSDRPEASCGDIVSALPLAQSTVSQHLQVLKDTGILTCTVHGRSCYYTLDRAVVGEAKLQVDELWQRFKSE
ncbi:MAG: helix-turn-helix transcriptional regulator [Rhodobacteraceae bacterium]|nr:helix-turn-helix transcriptional regulator [Paracoccaceae bacterium]